MAIEEMFTELPTVASADMSDIICAVQGYVSPTVLGLSVQETLQQVYNLFQSNIILFNAGDPNGSVAGTTYQFLWDTADSILFICTTSGTSSTAVWTRADINSGYTTTATAAATTTLTVLSNYWQFFTGSTTQTVVMPVTSTLAAGMTWALVNNSSGGIAVQSSGLNAITTIPPGSVGLITCILNSGTTAASWNASLNVTSGGSLNWQTISGTTQAAAIQNGYTIGNAGLTTVTLPATAPIGSIVAIAGQGAAGWTLAANAGQTIKMAGSTTSSGGSLTSAAQFDSITVVCSVADTTWVVQAAITAGFTIV